MAKRPAIVYCCFGELYAEMLEISLQSLQAPGQYSGKVLIITDLMSRSLRALCPSTTRMDVETIRVRDGNAIAAKLARYRLYRYIDLAAFAPLLYVDCDIIFDKGISPILDVVASATMICFPGEPASIAMWSSMGGNFFRAENLEVPGSGFNSGTMGIPDGSSFAHRFTLQLIASTVMETWDQERPLFDRWVDQPVVNYLQEKYKLFDTHSLTRFLRYSFQHDVPDVSVDAREGAVHFFDDGKVGRMRGFLYALDKALVLA